MIFAPYLPGGKVVVIIMMIKMLRDSHPWHILMMMIVILIMTMIKIVTMMMIKTRLLLLPFQASAHTWTQAAPDNCNHIIIFFSQTRISFTFISYFIHTLILY